MEAISRYSCLGRDAPVHRFPQPGNFREGVGVVLSYSYETRGRDSFKGGRFVTPQKSGYRFLCCYSFRPFLHGNFPLDTGWRPEKSRRCLALQHLPLLLLQVVILFPLSFAREYARMLPRSVRCVAYQLNSIGCWLMELNPGKSLDLSKGCVNLWRSSWWALWPLPEILAAFE